MSSRSRSSLLRAILVIGAISSCHGVVTHPTQPERVETSLDESCVPVRGTAAVRYAAKDLGAVLCPSPPGVDLWLVSSDANSWLDIGMGNKLWSSEEVVVYRPGAGMFPNVTGRVVWLRDTAGNWQGLVFGVVAQDEEGREHFSYVGVNIDGGRVCAVGIFASQSEAELSLRAGRSCNGEKS